MVGDDLDVVYDDEVEQSSDSDHCCYTRDDRREIPHLNSLSQMNMAAELMRQQQNNTHVEEDFIKKEKIKMSPTRQNHMR